MRHEFPGKFKIGEGTCGKFNLFVNDNEAVFEEFFKAKLFPGSINIGINSTSLTKDLDNGKYQPDFVIPRERLTGQWMKDYLGNGQAWKCELISPKLPSGLNTWIFRRINSGYKDVIEILSTEQLVKPYSLLNEDEVTVAVKLIQTGNGGAGGS